MLRVKVTLLYVVLVAALVGLVIAIVQTNVGGLLRGDAESALRRTAVAAEQSARLDEGALLAKAEFVSRDDRLYRSLKGEFVGGEEDGEGDDGAPADFEGQRHLDAHEKLTARRYRLDGLAKAAAEKGHLSHSLLTRAPLEPDLFVVLDAEGVGVAALGKDLYSWFGMDVAEHFASVGEVASGGPSRVEYWMWSFKPTERKRLYQVAVAPVRPSDDTDPSGVVILGTRVNDGLAADKKATAAGLGDFEDEDEGEAGEELAVAPEVVFYRGTEIVGSTLSTDRQQTVAAAMASEGLFEVDPNKITEIAVGEVPHAAMSRQLSGGDEPVGIVVLANLEKAREPLSRLRIDILLLGVVILLVGAFGFVFLIVRWMRPIEDLEDGMQEVIAGNKDHVWTPQKGHSLQEGLAQSLNLMSAYLQGKPMPDEDNAGQSWGDLLGGGDIEPQGPGAVQGVDLAALSSPPKKKKKEESEGEGDGEES